MLLCLCVSVLSWVISPNKQQLGSVQAADSRGTLAQPGQQLAGLATPALPRFT